MIQVFSADFENNSPLPLYMQLYQLVKSGILAGKMEAGERMPSLRNMAQQTGLSVTTITLAYDQLQTEGYIVSRPQSGYYVAEIPDLPDPEAAAPSDQWQTYAAVPDPYLHDLTAFDFRSWKKCVDQVYKYHLDWLLSESDPQGEPALRFEISRYVQESRGVQARPDQVVVGAGTQQLMDQLSRILKQTGIEHLCVEDPGYLPIRRVFQEKGFGLSEIPVRKDGVDLELLPVHISSVIYVCPANQFPTGAVMPVANRYALLDWAKENRSFIIEDDYDSELRYFGRPIPALQGLDREERVIYLGSFSSTLFPAIRIRYMILPRHLLSAFASLKQSYRQTCSKTEQLTLALFMEEGYYASNIRRLRTLYARKLSQTIQAFSQYGKDLVKVQDTKSGISLLLHVLEGIKAERICQKGQGLGLRIEQPEGWDAQGSHLIFYYNQLPLEEISQRISRLCTAVRDHKTGGSQ